VVITLTDSGRELIDQATARHMENEHHILSGIGADDQRRLADLLRKLINSLPSAG
jgi:DNA-binding MarR family transcriptional regulator